MTTEEVDAVEAKFRAYGDDADQMALLDIVDALPRLLSALRESRAQNERAEERIEELEATAVRAAETCQEASLRSQVEALTKAGKKALTALKVLVDSDREQPIVDISPALRALLQQSEQMLVAALKPSAAKEEPACIHCRGGCSRSPCFCRCHSAAKETT